MASPWFGEVEASFRSGRELPAGQLRAAMLALTEPGFDPREAGEFLKSLAVRGETPAEVRVAVEVLRERMIPLPAPAALRPLLDTCGTGGDGSGTFNISTAVSLVLAGAGVHVVKHGNRSASSRSGSADVLAALGVEINQPPEHAARTLAEFGYAFCFAPVFHPALRHVAPLRRELGCRTIFNYLGPLLNPASATHQLLGVATAEAQELLAGAVCELGHVSAYLVRSLDGLDEISLSAPTEVAVVRSGRIERQTWTADAFGLPAVPLESLRCDGPEASAEIILGVLGGRGGPHRQIVLANAAAGLHLLGRVETLPEGVAAAATAIDSGKALQVLERLRGASR